MNLIDLHDTREHLNERGILISFTGPFAHSIVEELGKAVKKYLESEEIQKSALMDVFAVYVEATQNLRNYTTRPAGHELEKTVASSGIITIGRHNDRYMVSSGNLVREEDLGPLVSRLERLRGLDKAGLRALYKEQLRRERPPGETGAGLGLIDMARKATEPLQYSVKKTADGRVSFFTLRIVI